MPLRKRGSLKAIYFVHAMRFSDAFLDEIRARIPVSEVVRRKVQLKKQGREWRGLSPFNKEKTPSFFVNDQKGFYHDFSSGKSGDIFTFLIETEGLSFPEAVERLASIAGIELPKSTLEDRRNEQRRSTLGEIVALAEAFFRANLESKVGQRAREYLASRGVTVETQAEFGLGYAPPDRTALKQHLASKGIAAGDMIEAGLLIAGEDIPVSYDRFRDRIIIPIHDSRGRVVGFGGRAVDPGAQPKYLNSPETPLFHKGSVVFNFHRARQPAHDDGSVVVVEGYMDAISVYQAGLKSVVATMGTAFTENQIESLWRLSAEPIVCFDSDRAGVAAAHRSIDRILPNLRVGRTFRFAFIQGGKDPDDVVRQKGLAAFQQVLRGSLALWDVLWERELASNPKLDSPDAQAALEYRLISILKTIKDQTVYTAYFRTCRVELSTLFWQAAKAHRGGEKEFVRRELKIDKEGHRNNLQKILLGILVQYPEFIDQKSDEIAGIHFSSTLEAFRVALYDLLIMYSDISVTLIYGRLPKEFYFVLNDIHGDARGNEERGYKLFSRFPILRISPPEEFVERCIDHFVRILRVEQMEDDLGHLLEEAGVDDARYEWIIGKISELVRQLHVEREAVNQMDRELADEAKELRRLGETGVGWKSPLAA